MTYDRVLMSCLESCRTQKKLGLCYSQNLDTTVITDAPLATFRSLPANNQLTQTVRSTLKGFNKLCTWLVEYVSKLTLPHPLAAMNLTGVTDLSMTEKTALYTLEACCPNCAD